MRGKVLRPRADSNREKISQLDAFKGVTKNLVINALLILKKMEKECVENIDLVENYYLLYHYLDYLNRFCDGEV
ncbi:MAG: hypothetical protein QXJ06_03795 [Candidatus Aenigmatarchaeota archaeon]